MFTTLLFLPALAEDPARLPEAPVAAPEAPVVPPKPKAKVDFEGMYNIWGLTQRNFLFGADNPLDDAGYTVQMLRGKVTITKENIGAVARMDVGQGWWGVDNSPNSATAVTTTLDADGNPVVTGAPGYNADKLFANKDVSFGVHLDQVYGFAKFPETPIPLELRGGRMYFGAGHKLVLDENFNGVTVIARPTEKASLELSWAKVSEGQGAYTTPVGALMSDTKQFKDADLFLGRFLIAKGKQNLEVFGGYYLDPATDEKKAAFWSMYPNGLAAARARYSPNINQLILAGVSYDGEAPVAGGLMLSAEVDVLSGRDDIDNPNHGGGTVDINDGTLFGYNAYAQAVQKAELGIPVEIGATFGLGSGDADPTGGAGNVNHLQTMGFFPLTNVWEDSVMPDIEGISPQGLGSPVSRGYREFENTTAVVGRVAVMPWKPVRLEVAYGYFLASQPVHGFDPATGVPTGDSASDLGMEVDSNLIVKFTNGLIGECQFGYFLPGDAAGYLINGNTTSLVPAWEVKNMATVKF